MIKTTIKKLKNGLTMVLVEDKNKNQKDYNEEDVIEFIVRSIRRESK